MIKKADISHKLQIAELWNEAFGDSVREVLEYLEYLIDFFYICEEDGELNAMAAVLPVSFSGMSGGYIYAVATRKSMRGRGLSTKLLEYIKKLDEYDFLVLVPQNESLFSFYEKRGFFAFSSTEIIKVPVDSELATKVVCKEISAEKYLELRKRYVGEKLIEWGTDTLNFAKKMYGAGFFEVEKCGQTKAVCFCFKIDKKLIIKELLGDKDEPFLRELATFFGCEFVEAVCLNSDAKPCAMIYPELPGDKYFSISMD